VKTSHVDALFRAGMRFDEAYVAHPTCGPSRAALLTGRHKMRIGFPVNPDNIIPTRPENLLGLPRQERTLADLLKEQGYATGMVGKWHLGRQKANHPMHRGFDTFYGFLGSLYRYFDLGNHATPYGMLRGFDHVHEKEYLTDAITRESLAFIERHREQPFFLYIAHLAVHTPLMYDQDPGRVSIPLDGTDDPAENRRKLVNMIEGLDRSVGAVMSRLAEFGLDRSTLVFFLSDNGGPLKTGAYSNGPLRDGKGSVYEGGVRVPMAACWTGRIAPGTRYPWPVSAMDIFATAVSVAGGELPTDRVYDSKNLMPILTGAWRAPLHDEPFYWESLGMRAVRRGDWKLIMRGQQVEGLYNIREDPGEQKNRSADFPERTRELQEWYARWTAECPAPAFKAVGPAQFTEWEKTHGAMYNDWK
jgi:arylsulfatase A-like enzyme